jgi:uncharacterized membrane protein YiaA
MRILADRIPIWACALIAAGLLALLAVALLLMGRPLWCECGYIKVWHGVVKSSENSQHITDWYTFTHVVHGIAFYFALWVAARRLPAGQRFVLAVLVEATWEVIENTPMVIERYRTATISFDYYGDSVINSMADIAAMMLGFWVAKKLPVWGSLAVVIATELLLAVMIRDNLTLNMLMLLHPFEAVRRWQAGG